MGEPGTHSDRPTRPDAERVRNETALETWDRNLTELLQELRVAQTGVQFLFAFLLTLPFTNRFAELGSRDIAAYLVTLTAAAVATGLFLAPASYHRIVFRRHLKSQLVRTASVFAMFGLGFLLVAMAGAIFLVVDVVSGTAVAAGMTAAVATLYVALWYVIPLWQLLRHR